MRIARSRPKSSNRAKIPSTTVSLFLDRRFSKVLANMSSLRSDPSLSTDVSWLVRLAELELCCDVTKCRSLALTGDAESTPLQLKLNALAELIAKLGSAAGLILFTALMIKFFVQLKTLPDR